MGNSPGMKSPASILAGWGAIAHNCGGHIASLHCSLARSMGLRQQHSTTLSNLLI
ncbi:hypothetical protein NG797_08455 [Laspinema sp. D5]|nr:hypothetical protein [Laspinema sp. D3d]